MGVIRNFIEVSGIASENDLPDKSFGQLIKYSEAENIYVPEEKAGIKDIYQIAISIETKSKRTIKTADCITVVTDGVKKLKIVYSQEQSPDKLVMLNLQLPYNAFFEIPLKAGDIDSFNVHILDAYFELLDKKRIYGHFVYLIDVRYANIGIEPEPKKSEIKIGISSGRPTKENNDPLIVLGHENFTIQSEAYKAEKAEAEKTDDKNYIDDLACLYL